MRLKDERKRRMRMKMKRHKAEPIFSMDNKKAYGILLMVPKSYIVYCFRTRMYAPP